MLPLKVMEPCPEGTEQVPAGEGFPAAVTVNVVVSDVIETDVGEMESVGGVRVTVFVDELSPPPQATKRVIGMMSRKSPRRRMMVDQRQIYGG